MGEGPKPLWTEEGNSCYGTCETVRKKGGGKKVVGVWEKKKKGAFEQLLGLCCGIGRRGGGGKEGIK